MLTIAIWNIGKYRRKLLIVRTGAFMRNAGCGFFLSVLFLVLPISTIVKAQSITELKIQAEKGDAKAQLT